MKLGIHTNHETASKPRWIVFDMEGYEANLHEQPENQIKFLVRPETRAAVTRVEKLAETQLKARGRNKFETDGSALPQGTNDLGDHRTRELAKYLVEDWTNVCDLEGNPLECNDTNKVWLFENLDIAVWVITQAKDLSSVRIEEERKNS
jgi:hypothetical protein